MNVRPIDVPVRGLPLTAGPLAPLEPTTFPAPLADALRARTERLGYLGAFFAFAAHQPDALLAFHDYTEALKRALPEDVTELVALTASAELGNEYEHAQHRRLAARLGLAESWIDAAATGAPADALTVAQRTVRTLTVQLLERSGHDTSGALADVVDLLGPEQAVAVLLLVGRYVAHGIIANALQLTPP